MRIFRISLPMIVAGLLMAPVTRAASDHETKVVRKTKTVTRVETQESKDSKSGGDKNGEARAADNTGINKRDRDDKEVTADQQSNHPDDTALTADIRRGLMDDKSLSTNAHNVKIIVDNGNVTLKGPVASAAEKATVEQVATKAAKKQKAKVTSELSVAP